MEQQTTISKPTPEQMQSGLIPQPPLPTQRIGPHEPGLDSSSWMDNPGAIGLEAATTVIKVKNAVTVKRRIIQEFELDDQG